MNESIIDKKEEHTNLLALADTTKEGLLDHVANTGKNTGENDVEEEAIGDKEKTG